MRTALTADRISDDLAYISQQLDRPAPVGLADYAGAYGRMRGTLISLRSSLGLVALELAQEPEPVDDLPDYDLSDWEAERYNYEPDESDYALDVWESEGGRLAS